MNASHNSLRDNLDIVSPEVDRMVTEAWKIDCVIGSRMTGSKKNTPEKKQLKAIIHNM